MVGQELAIVQANHVWQAVLSQSTNPSEITWQWRHKERPGVSSFRRFDRLFNHFFRQISKKRSKPALLALCAGNPPVTGGFPHKGPVTRKPFPYDDVIMMRRAEQNGFLAPTHRIVVSGMAPGRYDWFHYIDVIMTTMASQITSLTVAIQPFFQTQIKKKSKLRVTGLCVGISPGPVNSPHKGPVTRKMFPFDDVIMHWKCFGLLQGNQLHLPSDHRLRCRFHPTGRRPRPGSMPMMKDSVSSPVSVSPILMCRLEGQVSSVSTVTS